MGEIRKREITDRQRDFVQYLVKDNKNATESARLAGYAHPKQSAYELTRNPSIIALMRQARRTLYESDLANVAGETIRSVMLDLDAPASARVSAARTALELAGDLGKNAEAAGEGKTLAELSPDELAQMISSWEQQRSALATDITPQTSE
jgi:hypothetical protein